MSDIFPERFLPPVEAGGSLLRYQDWRRQQKNEARQWDEYKAAVLAHEKGASPPPAPTFKTNFGKMLLAAAESHMSVIDLGSVYPPPDPEPPSTTPVFTSNIADGQAITLPFTWTASVDPAPTSVQFWADGVLLEHDLTDPFEHELQLSAGTHTLALCAYHGSTRTCQPSSEHATVTIAGTPDPPTPSTYDFRFATFEPATDDITGCLNRFQPAYSWWVPGSPEGTPWPSGGGLHEITTAHGPGIEIVQTPEMTYPQTPDSLLGRFTAFHQTAAFRGQTHRWEWSWMWPTAGNPAGWRNNWVSGEGMTFATTNPSSQSTVGHHLYIHYANPMTFRFGRALHTTPSPTWNFTVASTSGVTFPPDIYIHMRVEIKWTENTDGFIRVYSRQEGGSEIQWVNFTGVTLPAGWNVWTVYQNTRTNLPWPNKNTLHWVNHRLTLL